MSFSLTRNPDVNDVWYDMLYEILQRGRIMRPRGRLTREVVGHHLVMDMTRPVLTVVERKLGYRFLAAGAAWILSGDDRVSTIAPYSGSIASYSDEGERFFGAYGPKVIDQLGYVVRTLTTDPDSRQAIINIWRENPPPTKDVPCTLSYQFLIREGQLDMVVTMRSNDAWLGAVYDLFDVSMIAGFVLIALRSRANSASDMQSLTLGTLYHTAGSRHLYHEDLDGAERCLRTRFGSPRLFSYASFDPTQFTSTQQLVDHLWALARRDRDGLHGEFLTELFEVKP